MKELGRVQAKEAGDGVEVRDGGVAFSGQDFVDPRRFVSRVEGEFGLVEASGAQKCSDVLAEEHIRAKSSGCRACHSVKLLHINGFPTGQKICKNPLRSDCLDANLWLVTPGREQLKQWTERAKLNQRELARLLNISEPFVTQILKGLRTPRLKTLVRIEDVTGIPVRSWTDAEDSDTDLAAPQRRKTDKFHRG